MKNIIIGFIFATMFFFTLAFDINENSGSIFRFGTSRFHDSTTTKAAFNKGLAVNGGLIVRDSIFTTGTIATNQLYLDDLSGGISFRGETDEFSIKLGLHSIEYNAEVHNFNNELLYSLMTLSEASGLGILTNATFSGRVHYAQGGDVASASTITLGAGTVFKITGSTTINYITTTGWQSGSVIYLYFAANTTLTNKATGTGQIINIGGNISALTEEMYSFCLIGSDWIRVK